MKIIKNKIKIDEKISRHIPKNSIFLDIETTGFSNVYNRIYLIGLLSLENGEYTVTQFLTEEKDDEPIVLYELEKYLNEYDSIITFNGDTFDLKFILNRMKKFNISSEIPKKLSIDLLKYIREEGFLLDLTSRKLKDLERYLGIFREDIYSGGELIEKYKAYEEGDLSQEPILLLHNYEDIINMPELFQFVDIIDEKNTLVLDDKSFRIESLLLQKNVLKICGKSTISKAYYNHGSLGELNISDEFFEFKKILKSGNYDEKTKCLYLELEENSLSCNYNITTPENLLLIKMGKEVLYLNAFDYFEYFLNNFT